MPSIISRYLVREVITPFCLTLLVFTFLMLLPAIRTEAEELIRIGVDARDIAELLLMLTPQSLSVTIPMALLVGVLMALGRLSGDREMVAMQACGVSLFRVLTPLLLLAAAATAVDFHLLASVVPDANQRFRDISLRVLANRAEGEVKPRVFYVGDFPDVVLYVQEVSSTGAGWSDVFLADVSDAAQPDIYVAARGRVSVDRERESVAIVLEDGERHLVDPSAPDDYEVHSFGALRIQLNAESLFPVSGPQRGLRELTVAELREEAVRMREAGLPTHAPIMELHTKFSIPVACFVFVLLGVAFGVSNGTDGRLASFALGIAVIFAYYVLMYQAEALAKGQWLSAHLARWLPNIVLGTAGVFLLLRRGTSVDGGGSLPWLRRRAAATAGEGEASGDSEASGGDTASGSAGTPDGGNPEPLILVSSGPLSGINLLDRYVTKMYLRWMGLAFVGLLGIFYIVTFIDLSDKLFKDQASGGMLLRYFWHATPQYVYYVLPVSGLVATLVTIGLLTRTSELTVMKACGISLYRAAFPILCFSLVWSGLLFGLGETVLGRANREAETLNREIRTGRAQTDEVLRRQWLYDDGVIYHYRYFDVERSAIDSLSVFELGGEPWSLTRRKYAAYAAHDDAWEGHNVWVRDFAAPPEAVSAASEAPIAAGSRHRARGSGEPTVRPVQALPAMAEPDVFAAERPDAELMTFRELDQHIVELRARGFDVVDLVVDLHRKLSFPFVTFILALIAVPFAVTTGPRGALYGVGVGIALAFTYWLVLSVFGALGSAGVLMPATAAWAPNLIFGTSAGYFLLTVRT